MSVTDLVSPAWCELQYWYSLTKYGRVKRTPAMKQGSSVHKVLEEQVHKAVPVDVVTKEDMFGLRIWNIIQGLRTLRATGMTREMEVWAEVEGQIVNGVIDELKFAIIDEDGEDGGKGKRGKGSKKEKALPTDQKTLQQFFSSPKDASTADVSISEPLQPSDRAKLYLTDVKTRGSKTVPSGEVSLRPTYMQLMLYHKMLSLLASNSVPAARVFARYNIQSEDTFSDTFLAQISGLDYGPQDDEQASPSDTSTTPHDQQQKPDPIDELLAHNTPSKLWTLMIRTFAHTIPITPTQSSISPTLRAEFRTPGTGAVLGSRTFEVDDARRDAYVRDEMAWWKGERRTRGVDVEEAFKCRMCEFAEACEWRVEKVEAGLARARAGVEERRRSEV